MATRATVAAVHGRRVLVDGDDGDLRPALLARRNLQPVCGDRVALDEAGPECLVIAIEERGGELWRHDARHGRRLLAANLDRLCVVTAPRPLVRPEQIDRYLAIATLLGLPALLVRNKCDLEDPSFDARLAEFEALGYPVLPAGRERTHDLAAALAGHTAIFVGLSGVGKSSLINALVPDHAARTAALSSGTGEGRHTTTTTRLYRLPGGGALIDSPGVRDIRLWPTDEAALLRGFPELARHAAGCRFRDCRHDADAGCAVRAAAESGAAGARRYHSYRTLAARIRG